ncbi:hypothetical protein HGRIS_010116 [Hohenbuehelia grisea]|uniref:Uncharacterized protein n=1 Tax=Hohenbuehelia grisea TaxID=104357 RepID=A0ABR3J398_9AGAR
MDQALCLFSSTRSFETLGPGKPGREEEVCRRKTSSYQGGLFGIGKKCAGAGFENIGLDLGFRLSYSGLVIVRAQFPSSICTDIICQEDCPVKFYSYDDDHHNLNILNIERVPREDCCSFLRELRIVIRNIRLVWQTTGAGLWCASLSTYILR